MPVNLHRAEKRQVGRWVVGGGGNRQGAERREWQMNRVCVCVSRPASPSPFVTLCGAVVRAAGGLVKSTALASTMAPLPGFSQAHHQHHRLPLAIHLPGLQLKPIFSLVCIRGEALSDLVTSLSNISFESKS